MWPDRADRRPARGRSQAKNVSGTQDYAGLRAELATLVDDFSPVINELWPRLEDHKYQAANHETAGRAPDRIVTEDRAATAASRDLARLLPAHRPRRGG
jgi:hypothetical protein